MTSMPASRNARAMTFTPRSWPSSPGLASSTLIRCSLIVVTLLIISSSFVISYDYQLHRHFPQSRSNKQRVFNSYPFNELPMLHVFAVDNRYPIDHCSRPDHC